jgi:transcriptional regulator with XRE-family HTH domain
MNARQVLARNLTALMDRYPDIGSQKLLFKTTGVATSTVGRIRRGEVAATLDNIEALAKAFRLTVSQMLDPRLTRSLEGLPPTETRALAAALAAEIQDANLSDAQLSILANTLAAMRSR